MVRKKGIRITVLSRSIKSFVPRYEYSIIAAVKDSLN